MQETQEVTTTETHKPQVVTKVKTVIPPPIKTEHPQKVYEKKKAIFRSYQVIWYILILIEVLLGFRMTFKAIGANPFSGFVSLINAITGPLTLPFSGIIPSSVSGNTVVEWSTVVAAIVYLLIAVGLVNLFQFVKPVTPEEVEQGVDEA